MRNFFLVAFALTSASASASSVKIAGGADDSGHQYVWTVTNDGPSAVVQIEFPQYHASLFFTPDGWTQECTNLVKVGGRDAPGNCIARANPGTLGIVPGRSAEFRMQIASAGAQRTPGTARITFSDGHVEGIGVELPAQSSAEDRYISLVGLGVIFLIALAVRCVSKRRRAHES
ncbi:MAG: hypothetical protein HY287_10390 [Planctomycetes bacterium]|nr:hypothetical protein [Planctomycetota bacterium]MBI3834725.1 hypothetical protein [Planctomycetota bacterium]